MSQVQTYSEDQLVALLKQQSREAFNYIYDNYAAVLLGVIKRIVYDDETARDILQETFVKIWDNIARYDPGKGRIYTWMINIARNAAIDKTRSKGEVMKGKIRRGEEIVHTVSERVKTEIQTDTIGLTNLVGNLKPEHQIIVQLAYFEGYTLDEIAKKLGLPLGTVKTRMRSAIKQLRSQFSS